MLSFEVNADMIDKAPTDWSDLLKADYKNAVSLAGDPRSANQRFRPCSRRVCRKARAT